MAAHDEFVEYGKCAHELLHGLGMIWFTVVGGQPSSGSGCQESAVSPSILLHRVDKNQIALIQRQGDG